MTITLRPLLQSDHTATADLLYYIWNEYYTFVPPEYPAASYTRAQCAVKMQQVIDDCIASPARHRTAVAEENGQMLGFCYMSKNTPDLQSPWCVEGPEIELDRFYLKPDARGRGIGAILVRDFCGWFIENGYKSCFAWSFDLNPSTGFYTHYAATPLKTVEYLYKTRTLSVTAYVWTDFPAAFTGK